MNPLFPLNEYVPDGEPHVFGDRVYLYGSHDEEGGTRFCTRDYTVWSAPVTDLSDWTCHGVTYKKSQDPRSKEGRLVDFYAAPRGLLHTFRTSNIRTARPFSNTSPMTLPSLTTMERYISITAGDLSKISEIPS